MPLASRHAFATAAGCGIGAACAQRVAVEGAAAAPGGREALRGSVEAAR